MQIQAIDNGPSIVLSPPDLDQINTARRFLKGAAMMLLEAANGDLVIEKIANEAMTLACVTEIVLYDRRQTRMESESKIILTTIRG